MEQLWKTFLENITFVGICVAIIVALALIAKLAEKCGLEFAWVPEKLFLFGMYIFL